MKNRVRSLASLHLWLKPGELLEDSVPDHPVFKVFWKVARADTFAPPEYVIRSHQPVAA